MRYWMTCGWVCSKCYCAVQTYRSVVCDMVLQVFMYYKACPDDNEYAHPMDLCPVVDLYAGKVIHIDAYPQPPTIPMRSANYHRCAEVLDVKCSFRFRMQTNSTKCLHQAAMLCVAAAM